MDIYFKSKKLKKTCSEAKVMQTKLGKGCAKKLQQRMYELDAAISLIDISHLPPARCHELTGKQKGIFSVDVEHPYRLLFKPKYNPIPQDTNGGIDKSKIIKIEIISIEDTH